MKFLTLGSNLSKIEEVYTRYKAQREAYKEADRNSLDARLTPEREAFAAAIREILDAGGSISAIQEELGTNNRNLLYSILKGVPYIKYGKTDTPKQPTETDNVQSTPETEEFSPDYDIVRNIDGKPVEAAIDGYGAFAVSLNDDGTIRDIPNEWFTNPSHKTFFRKLIAEIEGRV